MKTLLMLSSLMIISLFTGCFDSKINSVVFVLFDASISTNDRAVREHYFEDFQKLLNNLHGQTQLVGDVITGNTMATATFPLDATITGFDQLTENLLTYKERQNAANKDIINTVKKIIDTAYSQSTDLLNSFQLAGKVFEEDRFKSAPNKILVVFSDMIEDSENYRFEKDNLNNQRINAIIKKEKDEGGLPELTGVKVYVVGATANSSSFSQVKPGQIYAIERFWMKYFADCGANITDSRYATRLLNFEY